MVLLLLLLSQKEQATKKWVSFQAMLSLLLSRAQYKVFIYLATRARRQLALMEEEAQEEQKTFFTPPSPTRVRILSRKFFLHLSLSRERAWERNDIYVSAAALRGSERKTLFRSPPPLLCMPFFSVNSACKSLQYY